MCSISSCMSKWYSKYTLLQLINLAYLHVDGVISTHLYCSGIAYLYVDGTVSAQYYRSWADFVNRQIVEGALDVITQSVSTGELFHPLNEHHMYSNALYIYETASFVEFWLTMTILGSQSF